ncbi:unnamed protein product [Penicillium manginii]
MQKQNVELEVLMDSFYSPQGSRRKTGLSNKNKRPTSKTSQVTLSAGMFKEMKKEKTKLVARNKELRVSIRDKNKLLQSSKLELEDSQRSFRLVKRGLRQQLKSTKLAMSSLQEYSRRTIDDLNQQLVSSQLALENLEQRLRPDTQNTDW